MCGKYIYKWGKFRLHFSWVKKYHIKKGVLQWVSKSHTIYITTRCVYPKLTNERIIKAIKRYGEKKKIDYPNHKNEIEKKDDISGGIQHLVKKRNIKIFETISSIEEEIDDYLSGNFNYSMRKKIILLILCYDQIILLILG